MQPVGSCYHFLLTSLRRACWRCWWMCRPWTSAAAGSSPRARGGCSSRWRRWCRRRRRPWGTRGACCCRGGCGGTSPSAPAPAPPPRSSPTRRTAPAPAARAPWPCFASSYPPRAAHTPRPRENSDQLRITFTARAGERRPARRSLRGDAESAPEIPRQGSAEIPASPPNRAESRRAPGAGRAIPPHRERVPHEERRGTRGLSSLALAHTDKTTRHARERLAEQQPSRRPSPAQDAAAEAAAAAGGGGVNGSEARVRRREWGISEAKGKE